MSDFENKVLRELGYIRGKMDGICQEQEDNKDAHKVIFERLDRDGKDIAKVQVKAGLYGSISGAIGGFVASFLK